MNDTMTAAGTFSGIAGFELGFTRAGIDTCYLCELVEHRQCVLHRHFPDTPLGGDIRYVHGRDLGHPDIIVGGFPCKGLTIAKGHRQGLRDRQSRLYFEFHRLVDEYLRLADESRARWLVLENTPGLLDFNDGRDMATVVRGVEELGYGWAYRVVDSRHFGNPQKRPRVVLVCHRGGDPRPAWAVLADLGPGRQAGAASGVGRGPRREPHPVRSGGGHVLIWRKSSNPRKSLALGGYETWVPARFANTLTGYDWGGPLRQKHLLIQQGRVRTLTLTEWERLSGFPDDWTAGMPDSERGDALGDCFHVDTAEWLGRRLKAVHQAIPMIPAA